MGFLPRFAMLRIQSFLHNESQFPFHLRTVCKEMLVFLLRVCVLGLFTTHGTV